jgi:hypothetical protein
MAASTNTVTVWLGDQKAVEPYDPTIKVFRLQVRALEDLSKGKTPELNPFDYGISALDPHNRVLDPSDTLGDAKIVAGDALQVFLKHKEEDWDKYWATGLGVYTVFILAVALELFVKFWPWSSADVTPTAPRSITVYFLWLNLGTHAVGPELLLLCIVLLSGIIGACIWSLYALSSHVSEAQDFDRNWAAWYFVRPFLGGGLAAGLYALLRAGLFTASSGASATSMIGVSALSFLVGLFTENAIYKLHDIADTVFGNPPSSPSAGQPTNPPGNPPAGGTTTTPGGSTANPPETPPGG